MGAKLIIYEPESFREHGILGPCRQSPPFCSETVEQVEYENDIFRAKLTTLWGVQMNVVLLTLSTKDTHK